MASVYPWVPLTAAEEATSITPAEAASLEAADAEGSGWGSLPLCLAYVGGRVLVHDGDSGEVPRLEGGEGDGELVALLQPGQAAEVGQALPFLLGHVIAVGQDRRADGGEPLVGADLMARDFGDGVPDLVVVVDGIEGLSLDPG